MLSRHRSHRRVPALVAGCAGILLGGTISAQASIIASTPTLPVLGVPYAASSGAGCFPVAGVCVVPGTVTFDSIVSSSFNALGQDIVVDASYAGKLTTVGNVPIGPISLTGTVEEEVLGRTSATELGSWVTDLVGLALSGPVLGHTLTLTLDGAHPSTGTTSITQLSTNEQNPEFRIDSFFDVFVDLSLDTTPPLDAKRGPMHLTLAPVPEPSSLALLAAALLALPALRRRSR